MAPDVNLNCLINCPPFILPRSLAKVPKMSNPA